MHLPFFKNCDLSNKMTSEYTNRIKEACDLCCMLAILNLFSVLCFLILSCDNIYVIALFQFICVTLNYFLETCAFPRIALFIYSV